MKKWLFGLSICMLIGLTGCGEQNVAQAQEQKYGMNLDLARRPYTIDVLKKYIDDVKKSGGNYVHLHLTDDENYALESRLLGQPAKKSWQQKDGLYRNPLTKQTFLSMKQMRSLEAYAAKKKIELIPEIDTPSHMGAILKLYEKANPKAAKKLVRDEWKQITLNQSSIRFVQALYHEVLQALPKTKTMHIGGDEIAYDEEDHVKYIHYFNQMNRYLQKKHVRIWIWNDSLLEADLKKLDQTIAITFWSWTGEPESTTEKKYREKVRPSAPQLIKAGHTVYNYNDYYLYVDFTSKGSIRSDLQYMKRDIKKNWTLGRWNSSHQQTTSKISGAAISIWGEVSKKYTADQVYNYTKELFPTMMKKVK